MRKAALFIILFILCLTMIVNANTLIFEDDFSEEGMGDFSIDFEIFAPGDNYVSEGGNTYFHGRWVNGAYAIFKEEIENYTLYADFKMPVGISTSTNYIRSAIFLRNSFESKGMSLEPDNGDNDNSSYLGGSGIFFYCYKNNVEVGIHTKKADGTTGPVNSDTGIKKAVPDASKRLLGSYTVSYVFTIPEGKNFDNFTKVKVIDAGDKISFYVEETLICQLELSDIENVKTVIGEGYFIPEKVGETVFDEKSYRTVVVKDASGNEKLKVEDAVVSTVGYFGFVDRGSQFMIDNVKIELNYDVTPAPTKEPTPTPQNTPTPTTQKPATQTPGTSDKGTEDSNTLLYIFIAASAVIIGVIVFFIIKIVKSVKSK